MFSNILAISSDCPISPRINFLVDDTTTLQEFMWGIGWYHDNHNAVSIMKDNHVENLEALRALFDGNPNFCSSTFYWTYL